MRWKEVFDLAIKLGVESDIRDLSGLKKAPSKYYSDSQVLYGNNSLEVKNIFVTVDIGIDLILLVSELIKKGHKIDAIITHHPTSFASYRMPDVARIQESNWIRYGVSKKTASAMVQELIWEENISISSTNQLKAVYAAKELDIALMCLHTSIDNLTQKFFEDSIKNFKLSDIQSLFKKIKKIKECAMAELNGDGPYLIGEKIKNRPVGTYMVDMTGGLDPPSDIFKHLKECGVDTIIGMHYSIENIKAIIESGIAAIIAGHMASDSIGLNIFCDKLEEYDINIIKGPGFYRIEKK